jgi:hypothetical protein
VSPWVMVAGAWVFGVFFMALGRLRARREDTIEEALPECSIANLEAGRFRVRGRVVAIQATPSLVDGASCVYAERAEYRAYGTQFVPLLQEVEHSAVCHPFYLEDESGRILVDPGAALIDCATAVADGGLTAERRLRDGEEISLCATFRATSLDTDEGEGPYRASARKWEPIRDITGPPRLTHRTEHGMMPTPPDEISAFLGGAGGILLTVGLMIALATVFLG